MINFDFNFYYRKTSFIYEIGEGSNASTQADSPEAAKTSPQLRKEGDVLSQLNTSIKAVPTMRDMPADVRETIEGVRTEVQKVSSEMIRNLERVESGEVSVSIRNALKIGVRNQLVNVVGDLRTDPEASIMRVRTVIEDLSKIVKADFRDGRVHFDEVFIKGMEGGRSYDMHFDNRGPVSVGDLTVDGVANPEKKEGEISITGPAGFSVRMRAANVDSGTGASFSAGQKNSSFSSSANVDTDQQGNLSGGAKISVEAGKGSVNTSYSRDAVGANRVTFGLRQGGFGIEVAHFEDQAMFNLEYSARGSYVRTRVGVQTGDKTEGRISPDALVSDVRLEAGTPIPGGVVEVNVGQGGDMTKLSVTTSFNLLGGGASADVSKGASTEPSINLVASLGADLSRDVQSNAGAANLVMEGRF